MVQRQSVDVTAVTVEEQELEAVRAAEGDEPQQILRQLRTAVIINGARRYEPAIDRSRDVDRSITGRPGRRPSNGQVSDELSL